MYAGPSTPNRRNILKQGGIFGIAPFFTLGNRVKNAQASVVPSSPAENISLLSSIPTTSTLTPSCLVDLPMIRLKLPSNGFGREYVAIKLKIDNQGPYEFMIDSGLTLEMITPHLQHILGLSSTTTKSGLAAGGETTSNPIVNIDNVLLCSCENNEKNEDVILKVPKSLNAIITDFPQEHIDPLHDPIEGMLGMELLSLYDADFDFPRNRIRLWSPGTAIQGSGTSTATTDVDTTTQDSLVEIPAVVINETGLIGIRLSITGAKQPILGILDCGSTFSCMNWKAAEILGLPPKGDDSYRTGSKDSLSISAVGIDGRLLTLPTIKKSFTFVGEMEIDSKTGQPIGFKSPPKTFQPWDAVQIAVGDIPVFSSILGDGIKPYEGPAALIGLDVLGQRRIILEASSKGGRRRRVFVSRK
mmetsp:Transcript_22040/g.25085  ORF Transcript_22040/g.25085 Transcript_22040/m.25085 type:complete len:415 (+) Transcript_22040:77-1321(+)